MTDSTMIGRIAAACSILDLAEAAQVQWVECAERWGVRSPAAQGCLLALVREAWQDPLVNVSPMMSGARVLWVVGTNKTLLLQEPLDSEAEALVAALEAAPMTPSDIYQRVRSECLSRNFDDDESPALEIYSQWSAAVSHWGADSPAALGCLLGLVRETWGPDVTIHEMTGPRGGSLVISKASVLFKGVGGNIAGRRVEALEAAP